MKNNFTKQEWATIKAPETEAMRLQQFYRHWALKESYLKAIGKGLSVEPIRVSFRCDTAVTAGGYVHATATLDQKPLTQWRFVVSDLDAQHCVAIASKPNAIDPRDDRYRPHFREISFKELIAASAPDAHYLATATKSMSL